MPDIIAREDVLSAKVETTIITIKRPTRRIPGTRSRTSGRAYRVLVKGVDGWACIAEKSTMAEARRVAAAQ